MKKLISISLFLPLVFSCAFSAGKINKKYTLARVEEVTIEQDAKTNKVFYALRNPAGDSLVIYEKNAGNATGLLNTYTYTSNKNLAGKSVLFYEAENGDLSDSVNVVFLDKSTIKVANDIYTISKEYYNFLFQNIFDNQSVLDLADLTRQGFGDYAVMLKPLYLNWNNQKPDPSFKISNVVVQNKDMQAEKGIYFTDTLIYNYNKSGALETIKSRNRYTQQLVKNDHNLEVYNITDNGNERSISEVELYRNKKTLFDSAVVDYTQLGNNTESKFTIYQKRLEIKSLDKRPENLQAIEENFK